MNKRIIGVLLALICMAVPAMAELTTPFVIDGYVSNLNGDPCNDPAVRVTNVNTDTSWYANNSSASNYYRLVLGSDDVSEDDVLQFDVSWYGVSNDTQHIVVQEEIPGGGCSEDITLAVCRTVTSCNSTGYPKDAFGPGETVYVKGSWFAPNTDYMLWIQPDPVNDGDPLLSSEDPSGITASDAVTTGADGSFGPTAIWSDIPEGSPEYYDIVVDNQDGSYFVADDGIDSATMYGIVAPIPELATIALFAVGLVMLLGYMRLGRRD